MSTIEIDTKTVVGSVVVACDPTSTKPSGKAGNIVASQGDSLQWKCKKDKQSFLVSFNLLDDDDKPTWPFGEDQADHVELGVEYLRVNSKDPKSRKLTTTANLKYTVRDETVPIAEELDPVIIIRPGLRSIVAAGLPWAIAGAAIGALITWWTLTR